MAKRTASKRGGGTISATSRSAGTCGVREHSDAGPAVGTGFPVSAGGREVSAGRGGVEDTVPHSIATPDPAPGPERLAGRGRGATGGGVRGVPDCAP
ncbi:hypothetical protein GCM10027160_31340 [Streptomyces calidiresistens]